MILHTFLHFLKPLFDEDLRNLYVLSKKPLKNTPKTIYHFFIGHFRTPLKPPKSPLTLTIIYQRFSNPISKPTLAPKAIIQKC